MFEIPAIQATGSLLAGIVLGAFFFGGLWWTVRRLPDSRHPAALFLFSFAFRMALTLTGFWLVMGGQWERAMWCMLGFLVARTIIRRRIRPPAAAPENSAEPVTRTATSPSSLVGSLTQNEPAHRQQVT